MNDYPLYLLFKHKSNINQAQIKLMDMASCGLSWTTRWVDHNSPQDLDNSASYPHTHKHDDLINYHNKNHFEKKISSKRGVFVRGWKKNCKKWGFFRIDEKNFAKRGLFLIPMKKIFQIKHKHYRKRDWHNSCNMCFESC